MRPSRVLPAGWDDVRDATELKGRWSDPPVAGRGCYQVITRVIRGRHEGRAFWAFATPDPATRHGARRVVALDARRPLPPVRVEPQTEAQAAVGSRLRGLTHGGGARLLGVEFGAAAFDCRFRVRARSREEASAVLSTTVRQILLESQPCFVAFEGSDVLVWDEAHAETGPLGVREVEPLLHAASAIAAALDDPTDTGGPACASVHS